MNEVPKKLDYNDGIVPSERAREGLRMLGEDLYNLVHKKPTDIKTTKAEDGKFVNIINNYGYTRQPSTKFGFVRTVWMVTWCVFTILGVYTVIAHPEWIVDFGYWLKHIFSAI